MLTVSDYYDRQGEPIDMIEWGKRLTDLEYKRVAYDELADGTIIVSTVWLGLDHNWGEGRPLIFETMVFGGPNDQDQYRYSTEAEALAGHVERVKENNIVVLHEVRDRKEIES